jgi:hypothetical protein
VPALVDARQQQVAEEDRPEAVADFLQADGIVREAVAQEVELLA